MINRKEAAHYILRTGARKILYGDDTQSNPVVSDEWIVNKLRETAALPPLKERYEESKGFSLFQNSLVKVLIELGGKVPNRESDDEAYEAQRLIWALRSVFSPTKK